MTEKLEWLTTEQKHTKPFPEEKRPHYSEVEKHSIARIITHKATLTILKHGNYYQPVIKLRLKNFEAVNNFRKILKIGKIIDSKPKTPDGEYYKLLKITQFHQVFYILNTLKDYMPNQKSEQLRSLIAEFCASRIEANETARLNKRIPRPYNQREHDIVKEVRKLNKKGR